MELKFPLSVIAFCCLLGASTTEPVVSTYHGTLRGKLVQIPSLQDIYEFTRIPFAEPPVGELRFQKPVPKGEWGSDTLDATKLSPACIQMVRPYTLIEHTQDNLIEGAEFSEDCLYLNIWVPRKAIDSSSNIRQKRLPVFVFIYGGGFVTGTTMMNLYNGSVLAAHGDIIVATVAYRVGYLGFAYFGSNEIVPANIGMWDQLEGMKWIYDNIESFGGDNSQITIGGESAGAVSTPLHLLSPHSRKYFHRAILQSGSAIADWGLFSTEAATSVTKLVAAEVAGGKCNGLSPAELVKCFRTVPVEDFPKADFSAYLKGYGFGSAPTIDGDFLPRKPWKMLQDGDFADVPLLAGINRDEGSLFVLASPDDSDVSAVAFKQPAFGGLDMSHYGKLIESSIRFLAGSPEKLKDKTLLQMIELFYSPSDKIGAITGEEILQAAIEACGDYGFTCPTLTWTHRASSEKAKSSASKIFVYNFGQRSAVAPYPEWMGVIHSEELSFMFGQPLAPHAQSLGHPEEEKVLSQIILTYWANFIKTGDPNSADSCESSVDNCSSSKQSKLEIWPSYSSSLQCPRQVFEISASSLISKTNSSVRCNHKVRQCSIWDDIFRRLSCKLAKCSDNYISD